MMAATDIGRVPTGQAPPPEPAPKGRSRQEVRRRIGEHWWTPYLFIAPHFLIFAGFVLYPFFLGIWISLHDSSSLRLPRLG